MVDASVFRTLGQEATENVKTIDETVSDLFNVLAESRATVEKGALCLAIALHLAAMTSAASSDSDDPELPLLLANNSNEAGAKYAAILFKGGFMSGRAAERHK